LFTANWFAGAEKQLLYHQQHYGVSLNCGTDINSFNFYR
jgi:hypothetical protein